MQRNNDPIDSQDLIALVEASLIASAKEAAKIAKATGTPLVSKDSGGIAAIPPGLVLDQNIKNASSQPPTGADPQPE